MYTNTKIMFSKIAGVMTIFMMVFSLVAPIMARATEDGAPPIVQIPVSDNEDNDNEQDCDESHFSDHIKNHNDCDQGDNDSEECDDNESEDDCGNNQEVQISAYKVLCPSEDLLPNWGNGDGPATITSSTASDFVAAHPSCEIVPWIFEWKTDAPNVDENPGDNVEVGGAGWTTFASTVMVPANQTVWVREQLPEGYQTFSGTTSNPANEEVSAEFYCDIDVLNYDNYDYINLNAGHEGPYQCVGFNAHPDMCNNIQGIQVEVPNGYTTNDGGCFMPIPEEDMCQEGDETGWNVKYYNYLITDTGMGLPAGPAWSTPYGDPLSDESAWTGWSYGADKYKFSQVESDLMFGSNFFPFDSGTGLPFKNESSAGGANSGKDFHFGLHAKAFVNAPSAGAYAFTLSSDDDAWIYVNGDLVAQNPGVHPVSTINGNINLLAGVNEIDVYYADRLKVQTQLDFQFTGEGASSLVITPNEPCPPTNDLVCEAGVNLIANGSFENPTVTNGALWDIFPSGTPTLEWLVSWLNPSDAPKVANIELQKNTLLGVTASDGMQWTELDADQDGPSGSMSGEPGSVSITQSITTIPGKTYEVSFDFMPRPDVAGAESKIEALHDLTIGSTVDDTAGASWTNHSYSFVADDTSTEVTFRDAGATSNSVGTLLDNVSVTCIPPVEELKICGALLTTDVPNGDQTNPLTYDYVMPSANANPGDFIDHSWVQANGENRLVWDMGAGTNTAYLIPSIDHGPTPGESHEATLYGSNTPTGPWTAGVETTTYPNGPSTWTSDNDSTKWTFGMPYRYISALAGGTQVNDGDAEIDAICSEFTEATTEIPMCEWNSDIPADSENCVPPVEITMCEWNQDIPADSENCVPPEETPNHTSSGSRTSGGSGSRPDGEVLGASTDICNWTASYMRRGWKGNKSDDVKKVQQDVANGLMQSGLTIDGIYGPKTEAAIKAFQAKYADNILKPWGITNPTGHFYLSSLHQAQLLLCPTIEDPLPPLVNWSENPTVR